MDRDRVQTHVLVLTVVGHGEQRLLVGSNFRFSWRSWLRPPLSFTSLVPHFPPVPDLSGHCLSLYVGRLCRTGWPVVPDDVVLREVIVPSQSNARSARIGSWSSSRPVVQPSSRPAVQPSSRPVVQPSSRPAFSRLFVLRFYPGSQF